MGFALEQADRGVDLRVHGLFLEIVSGDVPALELIRVHLIVSPPAAQAGEPQDFLASYEERSAWPADRALFETKHFKIDVVLDLQPLHVAAAAGAPA